MDWQAWSLAAGGAIGGGTAIAHGVLMQRHIVVPIDRLMATDGTVPKPLRQLSVSLLHFTTFNWLASGLSLVFVALWLGPDARGVAGFLAVSSFLFGGGSAFLALRRPHPSWMLMSIAVALIVVGLLPIDGPRTASSALLSRPG